MKTEEIFCPCGLTSLYGTQLSPGEDLPSGKVLLQGADSPTPHPSEVTVLEIDLGLRGPLGQFPRFKE